MLGDGYTSGLTHGWTLGFDPSGASPNQDLDSKYLDNKFFPLNFHQIWNQSELNSIIFD